VPTALRDATRLSRQDTEEIIAQVRGAARSEIDRAADIFTQRARAATREIQPLVTEYTNKLFRWLRIIAVIVVVLVIAWFVFQAIAQESFFEWLGDRIDNLTD
jgi:DNA-binding PucR family transcriptional regulator